MIIDWLEEWFKGVLIDGIIGNLSGLFDTVNTKVGEIAADVGATPQGWNSGIFNMIRNLSESVIIPIAGAILAFVMTYELIQMVTEKIICTILTPLCSSMGVQNLRGCSDCHEHLEYRHGRF